MRESFVFHAEYIDDLPDEFKPVFAMYAINYGIYGEEPSLTGLEQTIWLKIQRRINHDLGTWEETKSSRSRAGKSHKGNQYTSRHPESDQNGTNETEVQQAEQLGTQRNNLEQNGTNGTQRNNLEQNGTNGTQRNKLEQNGTNGTVYVSVNDSVYDDDDGDGDGSVNAGVPPQEPPPPHTNTQNINTLASWCARNGFAYDEPTMHNMLQSLAEYADPCNFLDYVYTRIQNAYTQKPREEKRLLLRRAVLEWQNVREEYRLYCEQQAQEAAARAEKMQRIKCPYTACPSCGAALNMRLPEAPSCPNTCGFYAFEHDSWAWNPFANTSKGAAPLFTALQSRAPQAQSA